MADYYDEDYGYEVEPISEGEGYWGKRTVAYIIDSIFILFITLVLLYLIGLWGLLFSLATWWFWIIYLFFFGFIQVLYSAFLEGTGEKSYTIGKGVVDLEVVSLDGGPVRGGQAFSRNISKIFVLFLAIDILMRKSPQREDYTQKRSDIGPRTAIQPYVPLKLPSIPKPFKRVAYDEEAGKTKEKMYGDFPAHLLNGECPKCHSPYKIVPAEDKTTWSGLWNFRCTWCNKLVFDSQPGRIQPPKWY